MAIITTLSVSIKGRLQRIKSKNGSGGLNRERDYVSGGIAGEIQVRPDERSWEVPSHRVGSSNDLRFIHAVV